MSTTRLYGVDVARSLAVFGMIFVNFSIVMSATEGPEWLQQAIGLFEGRAAALFVILAGIGISLMTKNESEEALSAARNKLLIRALFLFVVGLAYTPLWPADILHFYGLYIFFAAFLLTVDSRYLLAIAFSLITGFVALLFMINYEQGWNFFTFEYLDFWTMEGMLRRLFYNGFHPVIPWLAFLLIGMVVGRIDLSSKKTRLWLLVGGISMVLIAEISSSTFIEIFSEGLMPWEQAEVAALFGTEPMPPVPTYMISATGSALAIISLCISLSLALGQSVLLRPFIHTGQLALTLYVAHVIIGMGILESMEMLNNGSLVFSATYALAFCVLSVVLAHLWRLKFKRGPLEILMRRLLG